MSRARSLTFTICLGGALLAAAVPASAATSPAHRLAATSHGTTVQARLFTTCHTVAEPGGIATSTCSDGIPSTTATKLPVDPRGTVTVTVGAPVTEISARHAGTDGRSAGTPLEVTPLDASMQRFSLAPPAGAPAALLLVSTTYSDLPADGGKVESGDAHFSIGLTQHRPAKVRPRRVTGQATAGCRPAANGVRRCRLAGRGAIVVAPGGAACRDGHVRMRVRARGKLVLQVVARTRAADCRFGVRDRAFTVPSGVARVVVETRFLGSPSLAARSAPDIRLRVR